MRERSNRASRPQCALRALAYRLRSPFFCAQCRQQARHIVGERRFELTPLAGIRMYESNSDRMQRLAMKRRHRCARAPASVGRIADQRMTERLQMDADLVRASG